MAQEDVDGGVAAKGDLGNRQGSDEWVAPDLDLKADEPIVSEARKRGLAREEAIEIGRRLGADTARQRGEVGEVAQERIERAMAYAAWDYDGRPTSGLGSKVPPVPDFKKGKK